LKFHLPTKTILYGKSEEPPAHLVFEKLGVWKAVNGTYANILELAAQGLSVPSPMYDYDWPCRPGEKPQPGQREMANHMVTHPRSFVFSSMRTGKTRAALWAMDWLMSRAKKRIRAVIVSDLMALERTWSYETLTSLLGRRTFTILHGTAQQRVDRLQEDVDFFFINHDGLKVGYRRDHRHETLAKALLARDDIKIAVLDEAAVYRNRSTATFVSARNLLSRRCSFVWAMTGTPMPNGVLDAYGIKKIVEPDWPLPYRVWQDRVTYKVGLFRREPRKDAAQEVDKILSPAIRISQEQVFDQTECKIETIEAPLSLQQKRYMRELKQQLLLMLENGVEIPAVNQAALRFKLIQCACGCVYDSEHESHFIDAAPRLELFDKLIAETRGKIIVFSPLINSAHMLHVRLGSQSLLMQATMSRKAKVELLKEFQHGPGRILTSHPGPVARGLDLACASTVVWYAPIDRTEHYIQANQRINGPVQKNIRKIYRLTGSSIETEIYERLEANQAMQGAILKLKEVNF
jgi:SNF2 family DNA or RNA helicase